MGDHTGIGWTDATWNPIVGCTHVSPGCDRCYAAAVTATRLKKLPLYQGLAHETDEGVRFTGEVRVADDRMLWPLSKQRARRIFVNSMSDLWHGGVDDETVVRVFATMALAQRHQFQVLTKRPQRMAAMVNDPDFAHDVDVEARLLIAGGKVRSLPPWYPAGVGGALPWPLPNVWLGTSVEFGTWSWRARHLRATGAAVRFLSIEPLIAPVGELDLAGIHQVIIGGESQAGARIMEPEWALDIIEQCRAQSVAVFFKQTGSELAKHYGLKGVGHDWTDPRFPEEFKVREYPA